MADKIEKVLIIEVQDKEALDSVKKVSNATDDLNSNQKKLNKSLLSTIKQSKAARKAKQALTKTLNGVGKAATKTGNLFKKAFAFTGAIALVTEGLQILKDLLFSNQKIVDAFAIATTSLNIVFRDTFNYLTGVLPNIINFFKAIFEDPLGSIQNLGNALRDNLEVRIRSNIASLGFLATAIKQVFEGDFDNAIKSAKAAGSSFVDSLTGVEGTIDKVTDVVVDGATSLGNYAKETINTANGINELNKAAQLAAAQQGRLTAQFDREAELQRQIRDDETLSIQERIKANNELEEVLSKREEALTKQAQKEVDAAKAAVSLNNTTENQIALIDALAKQEQVLADVTGQRSEQLVNANSLLKEQRDLENQALANKQELGFAERKLAADGIEDDLLRLQTLRDIAEEEREIGLKRLQDEIDQTNEGTPARIEAEKAFQDFKIASSIAIADKEKEIREKEVEDNKKAVQSKIEANRLLQDTAVDVFNNIGNAVLSGLEESSAAYKAFAIGIATTNLAVQLSNIGATNTSPTQPGNLISFGAIGAGATTVQGAAAIANYALNVAQISGAFAGGGEFITNGITDIRVGDNPGGRERVTVEPLSGKGQTKVFDNKIQMAGGGTVITDGGSGAFNTVSSTRDSANIASSVISAFKNMPAPIVGVEDIARVQARVQVKDRTNRLG